MSTKIYEGYLMTDVPTLYELRKRMARLRKSVQKVLHEEYMIRVAREATSMIDSIAMGKKVYAEGSFESCVLKEAYWIVDRRYKKIEETQSRDPFYDFSCSIEVIPIKDKVLVMIFCENKKAKDVVARQKYLKYYGYWDNTDPDKDCTEEEWEQRRQDWDKALPGVGVPSQNGFQITLNYPYPGRFSSEEIVAHIDSFGDRVNRIAFDLGWEKMFQKLCQKEKVKGADRTKYVFKANNLLRKEVRAKLPRKITRNMLIETKVFPEKKK